MSFFLVVFATAISTVKQVSREECAIEFKSNALNTPLAMVMYMYVGAVASREQRVYAHVVQPKW